MTADIITSSMPEIGGAYVNNRSAADNPGAVVPVKGYSADEVRKIRKEMGLTRKLFAAYLGVSRKTVEAWELGVNTPAGAASRILTMMEMDPQLVVRFPFIECAQH